jgi:hypothetical protein
VSINQAVTIKFYPTELDRALNSPGGPVGRYTNYVARSIAAEAQAQALAVVKRRTGRYVQGFKVTVDRRPDGAVFTISNSVVGQNPSRAASYASVLEFGSNAHIIRARPGNAAGGRLVFYVGGRKIVTQAVVHPGTKPYHILSNAQRTVKARLGY